MTKNPDAKFQKIKDAQIAKLETMLPDEMLSDIVRFSEDCRIPPAYVLELLCMYALDRFKKLTIHEYENIGQKLRKKFVNAHYND
jgi:hypothetical protein